MASPTSATIVHRRTQCKSTLRAVEHATRQATTRGNLRNWTYHCEVEFGARMVALTRMQDDAVIGKLVAFSLVAEN